MFTTDFIREDGRIILKFHETRKGVPLFSRNKIKTRDLRQWSCNSGASGALAHAELSQLIEADPAQVVETETGLMLHDRALAKLSNNTLRALGLPENPGFTFCLEQKGSLYSRDLRVVPYWADRGHQIRVTRDGVLLKHNGVQYIIPDPVFRILSVIDEYNAEPATDVPGQMALVARILELVARPEAAADPFDDASYQSPADLKSIEVRLEGALRDFKVKTARALSFAPSLRNDGYHITPVLFAPDQRKTPASEEQGLLTPQERLVFEHDPKKGFFSSSSANRTYLLESGEYILIDDTLFPAIEHIRALEQAPAEERARFAKDPYKAIAALYRERVQVQADAAAVSGDDMEQEQEVETILEAILIETQEFSERVIGLGLWVPPVIPWVKQQPNNWIPEEFGIKLGSEFINLPREEIDPLKAKIAQAIQHGEKTVCHNGDSIPATEEVRAALNQLIGRVRPDPESDDSEAAGSKAPKGGTDHQVLLIRENFDQHKYSRIELKPRSRHIDSEPPKHLLSTQLMLHQKKSFAWQIEAYVAGLPGVLNADDQGLGKTLQTIAFMAWQQENMRHALTPDEKKPMLVVAPTTLLKTWTHEVEEHMQGMFPLGSRIDAYGSRLKRLRCQGTTGLDLGLDRNNEDDRICWVLTTYQTLTENQVEFAKIDFATVVFDEIQNVKNVTTQRHRAAKALKADFVIGLTGTPVENNISELWAIMDTIAPGLLGSLRDFMKKFKDADENAYRKLHEELFKESYSRDVKGCPAIALRRMKSDTIADLPRKNYRFYPTDMPEEQAHAYDRVCQKQNNASKDNIPRQLRGVSLYPDDPESLHNTSDALQTMKRRSARIKAVVAIIDQIKARDEKVLLFIESLDIQHLLSRLLSQHYELNKDIPILNGQTSIPRRNTIVENFQRTKGDGKFAICILSPRAAGVGITMTAATHVIHLSRWWNPAVEEQCNDRIYRIGQDQDCTIHIPLAVHPEYRAQTFDCILNNIMERKKKLFRDILMPREDDERDQGEMIAGITTKESFDLKEIGSDWEAFEKWGARTAQQTGVWESKRTPRTRDAGCDIHLTHGTRGDTVLVQCKYTDDRNRLMGIAPVKEILHAATRYDPGTNCRCVVLSNAQGFDHSAQELARKYDVILVDRHRLCLWPTHII